MKKRLIERLQEKSPEVRKRIALTVSLVLTSFAALFAFTGMVIEAKNSEESQAKSPVQKSGFIEQFMSKFSRKDINTDVSTGTTTRLIPTSTPTSLQQYQLKDESSTTIQVSTSTESKVVNKPGISASTTNTRATTTERSKSQ